MKKNDIRVMRTYSQLISGFFELLNSKSFDELSVSEICEVSGVHRATFYKHFNDKLEFLNFCLERQLQTVSFDILEKDSSPEIIKKNIMHFVKSVLAFVDQNRVMFNSLCTNKHSLAFNSSFDNAINKFCFDKLNSVLSAPVHRIGLTSSFYSSAFVGVVKWYILSDDENLSEDVLDFISHRVDELCEFYEKHLMIQ